MHRRFRGIGNQVHHGFCEVDRGAGNIEKVIGQVRF